MTEADESMSRLAALAERAAPAGSPSDHVSAADLERVRAGASLAEVYRHLASCASCRARLTVPTSLRLPELAAETPEGRPRPRRQWPLLAMAAIAVLGVGYAWRQTVRTPDELAISRRAYLGVMGSAGTSASASPENANLELSFSAKADFSAFLLPVSGEGELLAAPRWFARDDSGRAVVVVAPRTFKPHQGPAYGFILWGDETGLQGTVRDIEVSATGAPSLAARERDLAAIAERHGARMQRVALEANSR